MYHGKWIPQLTRVPPTRTTALSVDEMPRAISGTGALDTEFDHIRQATLEYERANARVRSLQDRIASLHSCTVTVLGAGN